MKPDPPCKWVIDIFLRYFKKMVIFQGVAVPEKRQTTESGSLPFHGEVNFYFLDNIVERINSLAILTRPVNIDLWFQYGGTQWLIGLTDSLLSLTRGKHFGFLKPAIEEKWLPFQADIEQISETASRKESGTQTYPGSAWLTQPSGFSINLDYHFGKWQMAQKMVSAVLSPTFFIKFYAIHKHQPLH